ncbi:hypothetical protein BDF21DRAFT_329237, partial [Thamnidium elegans]
KFSKIIDDLENVEICYYDDPKRPSLQCTKTIYSRPFEIHTYKSEKEIANEADKEQEIQKKYKLNNVSQLVQFLNLIYLPDDPNNNITYERQFLPIKDILSKVWECSDLFDDASSSSFNKWCNDKKLGLLSSEVKRRKNGLSKEEFIGMTYWI